jgi:cytochrome o ubiquinol oxidase operon protein cyoD
MVAKLQVAEPTFHQSLMKYITGFASAFIVTLVAFWVVTGHAVVGGWLQGVLVILALIQLGVQLVFFLHLGDESRPRWQLTAFLFTVVIVSVIVAGSLWIMNNLNYNMSMTPQQMDDYMKIQAKKGF